VISGVEYHNPVKIRKIPGRVGARPGQVFRFIHQTLDTILKSL